jgi:molecular chaperone DnaK (HSP70)
MPDSTFCAIDFGTSNSAVAVPAGASMRLVELELGFTTMPTAVFYPGESEGRGRAACRRANSAALRSPPMSTASRAASCAR